MTERKLRIKTNAVGRGTVELNGRDITQHVTGIDVQIRAHQPTKVTIYLPPADIDLGILARAELVSWLQNVKGELVDITAPTPKIRQVDP